MILSPMHPSPSRPLTTTPPPCHPRPRPQDRRRREPHTTAPRSLLPTRRSFLLLFQPPLPSSVQAQNKITNKNVNIRARCDRKKNQQVLTPELPSVETSGFIPFSNSPLKATLYDFIVFHTFLPDDSDFNTFPQSLDRHKCPSCGSQSPGPPLPQPHRSPSPQPYGPSSSQYFVHSDVVVSFV